METNDPARNKLVGAMPSWLMSHMESRQLTMVMVADNAFDLPGSNELRRIASFCSKPGHDCAGLPPDSCSAFSGGEIRYAPRIDGQGCIKCSGQWGAAVGIIVPLVLILVGALTALYRWASKRQALVKRYLSTSIIMTNQVQTISCAARDTKKALAAAAHPIHRCVPSARSGGEASRHPVNLIVRAGVAQDDRKSRSPVAPAYHVNDVLSQARRCLDPRAPARVLR